MSDQGIKDNKVAKIFATTLIILSGLILYLDKIYDYFNITIDDLHGWSNQANYIWSLTQTISPILIMTGLYLRPFIISLFVPIFCYVLQFYFVINSDIVLDNPMTWLYVTGTSILILFTIRFIKKQLDYIASLNNLKIEVMEEIIDASNELLKGEKDNGQRN